jgi:hypothetical protein
LQIFGPTDNRRPRPVTSTHAPAKPSGVVHAAPQSQLASVVLAIVLVVGVLAALAVVLAVGLAVVVAVVLAVVLVWVELAVLAVVLAVVVSVVVAVVGLVAVVTVLALVVSVESLATHSHIRGRALSNRPRPSTSWHTPTEPSSVVHAAPQSQLTSTTELMLVVSVNSLATHSHIGGRADNNRPRPVVSSHTPAEPSAVVHAAPQSQLSFVPLGDVLVPGGSAAEQVHGKCPRQATISNGTA